MTTQLNSGEKTQLYTQKSEISNRSSPTKLRNLNTISKLPLNETLLHTFNSSFNKRHDSAISQDALTIINSVNLNQTSSNNKNDTQYHSVSDWTMDQNTMQSYRLRILTKKFQELNRIQSALDGNPASEDIELLNQTFSQLVEEVQQIYNDYKNNKNVIQSKEDLDLKKKRGKKKQSAEELLNDEEQNNTAITVVYTNTIQQKVSERLAKLFTDSEEFENLEKEIQEYEKKYGIQSKGKAKTNKIEENKKWLHDFNERREEILEEGFRIREERFERSKYIRSLADENHKRYTTELSRNIDEKLENANKRKIKLQEDIITTEKKLKWSYLVAYWVRILILIGRLEDDRKRRAAEEKQQRLTKVVYTRMMPIVWKRRSERWKTCWASFNRHWTFFQLWVTIKKKKQAARMIRSFLDETQSSMKLVRQVHLFKERIKKCQEYVKQYSAVYDSRLMSMLLQYTIVESKLIVDEPLSGDRRTKHSTEDETTHSARSTDKKTFSNHESRSSSNLNTPKGRPNSKKKGRPQGGIAKKTPRKKAFLYMEPKDMIADSLSFVRPSLQMRMDLLREIYIQKREQYKKELSEYSTVLNLYKQKYRQYVHYQRAQAILKNEGVEALDSEIELPNNLFNPFQDDPDKKFVDELIDEDGNVIPRPKEPFFSVFMTEEEMLEIVMKGFQRVRDLEEEEYSRLAKGADEDEVIEPNEDDIVRCENRHLKNVMRVFQELKSYFGDSVLEPYTELFRKANLASNDCVKERRELKSILKRKRAKAKKKASSPTQSPK